MLSELKISSLILFFLWEHNEHLLIHSDFYYALKHCPYSPDSVINIQCYIKKSMENFTFLIITYFVGLYTLPWVGAVSESFLQAVASKN